jgi:hypothetical protein
VEQRKCVRTYRKSVAKSLCYRMLKLLNYSYKNKESDALNKITSSLSTDR